MKKVEKNKLNNSIKILGTSLLFIVVPGSLLVLPWLLYNYNRSEDKNKSNEILGI